jgi:TonB family protein
MSGFWPLAPLRVFEPSPVTTAPRWDRALFARAASILFLALFCSAPGWASAIQPLRVNSTYSSLLHPENDLHRLPAHVSELTPTSATMAGANCESTQPAEALLTPDPLLPIAPDGPLVRVSFVIGPDGRVYSPFVLYSAGAHEDAAVLRAVRAWRFRPALCNGVPTDSEVRVRFGIHE